MTAPSQGDGGMVAAIEVSRGSFMRWHDGSEFTEQRTSLLYFEVPRSLLRLWAGTADQRWSGSA
jgi:hypothetical protein